MIISRVIYPRQVVAKIPFGVNETIYISALPTVNIRSKVLYILISGSTFTQHVYDGGWIAGSGGGGSSVHNDLTGKDALNQHPASAITGLVAALADKVDKVTGKELSSNDYTDLEKSLLGNQSNTNTGDQDLSGLALKSNVLELNNTDTFTPTANYHPATKKYVDDNGGGGGASDSAQTITYAASVTPDISDGNIITLVCTGDCVINNPTNTTDLTKIIWLITSNGYDVTWGTSWKYNALTLSSTGKDMIEFYTLSPTDIQFKDVMFDLP